MAASQLRSDAQREKEVRAYLDSSLTSKDPIEIAEAYYRLAKVENRKLDILESNRNLYKSIQILEKFGPSYELGRNYQWLAMNARLMKDREGTFRNINKSLEIYHACNSNRGKMLAYSILSSIYEDTTPSADDSNIVKTDYEKALYYADLSLKYAILENDESVIADFRKITNRLKSIINKGELSQHLIELKTNVLKKTNLIDYVIYSLDYSSYLIKKKQLSKARLTLTEAETLINKYMEGNKRSKMYLEKTLAEYYTAVKEFEKAIKHLRKFHEYHIMLLQNDRNGSIADLHIAYETEKRVTELKLKEQNLKETRLLLWLSGALLFFVIGLCVVLYRLNKKNKAISNRNALLVKEQNHRVKNNLQIVSSLLNMQANMLNDEKASSAMEEAQLRISSMIHIHRQLYDNDAIDKIDMPRFLSDLTEDILETYDLSHTKKNLELEKISLDADKAILIGLLVNELVSNSCKHAFKDHPDPHLNISLNKSNYNELLLKVGDNGLTSVQNPEQNQKTFGSKLIFLMVSQLDGTSSFIYSEGFKFNLKFNI